MHYRRLSLAVVMALSLLLPAVVMAQPTPPGNIYSLYAELRGDTEIPPGDPDGFGYARITIDLDAGTLCFQLSVARTDPPTASHIHEGAAGVAGPVVVPLAAPVDGLVKGCVDIEDELAAEILMNPGGYYVNVHSGAYPAGVVRGQLALQGVAPTAVPTDGITVDVVAEGLNSPRGVAVDDAGMVYVAQAGVGGDECVTLGEGEEEFEACFGGSSSVSMIMDGVAEDVISGLPSFMFSEGEYIGAQDVVLDPDGSVYGIVGLGMDPALREVAGEPAMGLGWIVVGDGEGGWFPAVDVAAYESASNPDGGLHDSNPFSGYLGSAGGVISDAGANALLSVPEEGDITTLAVFPDTMVDAPEFLGLPPGTQIPMQAVPTGVVEGPDGAWYVGQLTGFPFVPGAAKVWRVVPGEDPTVYAEGFTNIIDLAFDDAGNLFVLQITAAGLLNVTPEDPATFAGALFMVGADGTVTEVSGVSKHLVTPGGMAFGPDGTLYISNYGLMPGMGEVVSVTWAE